MKRNVLDKRLLDTLLTRSLYLSAALCCALLYPGCGAPTDPVSFGKICLRPTATCPAEISLIRNPAGTEAGRNVLDFELNNRGDAVTVEVRAQPASEAGIQDPPVAAPGEGCELGVCRTFELSAGEVQTERFVARELRRYDPLRFSLTCAGDRCPTAREQVTLEYVFLSEPLECVDTSDCGAGWICDTADERAENREFGQCVECIDDDDCDTEQSCSDLGRCEPFRDQGCGVVPSLPRSPQPPGHLFWLAGLLMALLWKWNSQSHWRRVTTVLYAAAVIFALVNLVAPTRALANTPRAGLSVHTGPRFFLGPLQEYTDYGIAFGIGQDIRGDHLGLAVGLEFAYFVTQQQPPPFSRDLQIYNVGIGPRAFLPWGNLEGSLGLDYRRFGFVSNSLVRITGAETTFDSVAAVVGTRLRWLNFHIALQGGVVQVFELSEQMITLDLRIGFDSDE